MNINSEYSIETYRGSEPLNLMVAPSVYVSDPNRPGSNILNPLYVQYNDFIDGISTIYSNQLIDGKIPVFWTIPSGDNYVPSSDSTLTQLVPSGSYYLIARSSSVLPLDIPLVGQSLDGAGSGDNVCSSGISINPCCSNKTSVLIFGDVAEELGRFTGEGISQRFLTDPWYITLTGVNNNDSPLSFQVSGLLPHETYNYTITSDSNWPVIIKPSFGSFIAQSDVQYLNSEFYLDPKYNLAGVSLCDQPSKIYSTIRIAGSGLTLACPSFAGDFVVRCLDCLPEMGTPIIAINGNDSKTLNKYAFNSLNPYLITTSGDNNYSHNLSVFVSGLEPNQKYRYNIAQVQTSCPYTMSNITGIIETSNDFSIINSEFRFSNTCQNLNACSGDKVFSVLGLTLTNTEFPCKTIQQNFTIECADCLEPCQDPCSTKLRLAINGDYSKLANRYVFDGISPYQVTMTGVGNNYYDLSIMVTGLVPHKAYDYSLNVTDNNWDYDLFPISGQITPLHDNHIITTSFNFVPNLANCEQADHIYAVFDFGIGNDDCDPLHESIKIICKGCLPACPSIPSVSFNDSPLLSLPSGCCHVDNPITVSVSNADPGTSYSYSFNSLTSNGIYINPATGIVSFGTNGAGKVSTLLDPDGNSPAVIKFTLTNTQTNTKSTDFLSVKCNVPNDEAVIVTPTPTTTSISPTPTPAAYDTTIIVFSGSTSNSEAGVTLAAQPGTSISFNQKAPAGLPSQMLVYVGGIPKAQISFYVDSYIGQSIRLIIDGISYTSTFSSGRKDF